jgi:signal transduction histidine kinase
MPDQARTGSRVRRQVLPALAVLSVAIGGLALAATRWPGAFPSPLTDVVTTLAPFPVAFGLGLLAPRWSGLAGTAWMTIGIEINQGYVNPFDLVLTLGPWYAGTIMYNLRRAARELAALTQQLETEDELLAEQTVRLERARIAHELHDIVAHNVSVMVVQAYAGARLTDTDQAGAGEALEHIRTVAAQAQHEIGHLVALLADPSPPEQPTALPAGLAELVTTAAATGIPVTLRADAGLDDLPATITAIAFRIVQEAITNALKHAPGAAIDITITRTDDAAEIVVHNAAATTHPRVPLQSAGGGHGITGMRDRVTAVGGQLRAGPATPGWQVTARIPVPSVRPS